MAMAQTSLSVPTSATYGGTTQAPVWVSATAPATPAQGTLWWNPETGVKLMYYVGPIVSRWVRQD